MSPFGWLYDRVLLWSRHPKAPWYLGAVSFSESSFFPIPPDVMLAPMTLATPKKWLRLAFITTITSVIGGIVGYLIGAFFIDQIYVHLVDWGFGDAYEKAKTLFTEHGFWAILIAGFTPIPYKVFTIAAGAAGMILPVFIVASFIGRGSRYLIIAGAVRWGGAPFETKIRKNVDVLGIISVVLLVAFLIYLKL